jgi:hypothetical protein
MNNLFEEEIRGHHSMRDHLLTVVSDADLAHSFETFALDWAHRQYPSPASITVASLKAWFEAQDDAMQAALSRFTEEELHVDRIDRGHGFVASPFVQHQIYREAVYILYGKLSVYLKALERDAGAEWAAWVG